MLTTQHAPVHFRANNRGHAIGVALALALQACSSTDGSIGEDGTANPLSNQATADAEAATQALNAATQALNAATQALNAAASNAAESEAGDAGPAPGATPSAPQAGSSASDSDPVTSSAAGDATEGDAAADAGVEPPQQSGADVPLEMLLDPLGATATCTTGQYWSRGENDRMRPGEACVECHTNEREGPRFTIAGTVYATGHEPDDCNGVTTESDAVVVITDANGAEFELSVNSVGNFTSSRTVAAPYTARVVSASGERQMFSPQTVGDCNTCHSATGTTGAPGRITLPFE